jgi:hypothetical protein
MQSRASDRERSRVTDRSSSTLFRAPFVRVSLILLVAGATLLLSGCGPKRVRVDFKNYENSYAVTSNREELLNLARLEQHDPTYFFKLGQISSSYRMEASFAGAGNYAPLTNLAGAGNASGGGTPGLIYENDPSFTLIPVDNDTNAHIMLQPVSATVFYSLYLQGWRLDQLFRLTVNRIEVTVPTKQGCQVEVIRNLPPPWFDSATNYQNDTYSLSSYTEFLRVSAVIYALQRHGLLLLRGANSFQPLDRASYIPAEKGGDQKPIADDPKASAGGVPSPGGGAAHAASSAAPTAKEFDEAAAKGQAWELGNLPVDENAPNTPKGKAWYLGANTLEPQFQLTYHTEQEDADAGWVRECQANTGTDPAHPCVPDYGKNVKAIEDVLRTDFAQEGNGMRELLMPDGQLGPDIREILEILYNGFSIEDSSADQNSERELCVDSAGKKIDRISAHLVMRSLIGLMGAAAEEQKSFDKLQQTNPAVPDELAKVVLGTFEAVHVATTGKEPDNTEQAQKLALLQQAQGAHTGQAIPRIEQIPVLKLTWTDAELANAQDSKTDLLALGLAVHYSRDNYLITDPKLENTPVPQNVNWNRDMFRLITELSSQVSVDISKFPLPEVLQLRTE